MLSKKKSVIVDGESFEEKFQSGKFLTFFFLFCSEKLVVSTEVS